MLVNIPLVINQTKQETGKLQNLTKKCLEMFSNEDKKRGQD
jgi:hypothetical protein